MGKLQRVAAAGGGGAARSRRRFAPPRIRFIPDLSIASAPRLLRRRLGRSPDGGAAVVLVLGGCAAGGEALSEAERGAGGLFEGIAEVRIYQYN